MPTKIPKDLSGPARWALVDQITGEQNRKQRTKPGKFKQQDYSKWNNRQLDRYATAVTGISTKRGVDKDRRAGRTLGRYIKDSI